METTDKQRGFSTKLVLLDLDGTLFDTSRFKVIIGKNLAKLAGVNFKRIAEIGNLYFQHSGHVGKFDPNSYCEFIGGVLKVSPYMLLQEFTYNREPYTQSLFFDALDALASFKKKDICFGIFSEGNINFQRLKIDYSGLAEFIDPRQIYLYTNKLDRDLTTNLPTNAVIVDDKKSVVDEFIKRNHEAIWINRKTGDRHQYANTITSLLQLNEIIRPDKVIYSK